MTSCEYTCCLLGAPTEVTTESEATTDSGSTTSETQDDCDEEDALRKCKKVKDVELCSDEPFLTGCRRTCCLLGFSTSTTKSETSSTEITSSSPPDIVLTETTVVTTTTELVTTNKMTCSHTVDLISKCVKLTELEHCVEEPFKTGCPYTCCLLGYLASTTMNPTTSVDDSDCDNLEDLASKCPVSATLDRCMTKEIYIKKCRYTCCKLKQQTTTEVTTETTGTPADIKQCDEDYEDNLSKCFKNVKSSEDCDEEPYFSGCKYTCCAHGFEYPPTTLEPTTSDLSTISGDICTGEKDRATKCSLLRFEPDPLDACKNDNFYKRNCDLSCCLEEHKTTTMLTTTTATSSNCNGLEDLFQYCELLNLSKMLCSTQVFQTLCEFTCCKENGGSFTTTTEPETTTTQMATTTKDG